MIQDVGTLQHDRAIAGFVAHACRDRKRQLLSFVDDEQAVSVEALMKAADETVCDVGHDILFADLMKSGVFEDKGSGELSLSRVGDNWLMYYGQPSPEWSTSHPSSLPPLRDWQVEALDAWAQHGRHGVVQAVTGTGKSRVGVEAAREAVRDDFSVVVCVPTNDLVDQWVQSLRTLGVGNVGPASGDKRVTWATHDVLVGTVQSLYPNPPQRDDGKVLLIADECHRYGARAWSAVLDKTYRRRLGLTATFERNDDGLTKLLHYFGGGPVFDIDFGRAIEEGVIAHYDVKLVGISLTPGERSIYDEAEKALGECKQELAMNDVTIEPFGVFLHEVSEIAGDDNWHPMQDAARRYLTEFARRTEVVTNAQAKFECMDQVAPLVAASRGALVFTRRVDTAEELSERLIEAGVSAKPIYGDLTRTERQERLAELKRGAIKALVAPTVLDEGVDVPEIDLAVVMGGSRSRRQMIQRMGRVLRLKKDGGKATFVVVYAKNTVEDITKASGVEGCLDLITASADSVQRLGNKDFSATEKPVQVRPVIDTPSVEAESSTIIFDTSDNAMEPGTVSDPAPETDVAEVATEQGHQAPAADVVVEPLDITNPTDDLDDELLGDLTAISLTRAVLDQHVEEHGGSDEDAAKEIAQMAEDFTSGARASVNEAGFFAVRRAEYTLVVDPTGTRFVRYRSGNGRMTWSQFKRRGDVGVWAQRPHPESAPNRAPLFWLEPSDFTSQVEPDSVCFTKSAFQQAARLLGLIGQSVEDEVADAQIRDSLATALVRDAVSVVDDGLVTVGGDGVDWILRSGGCTVVRVKARVGSDPDVQAPKTTQDETGSQETPDEPPLPVVDVLGEAPKIAPNHEGLSGQDAGSPRGHDVQQARPAASASASGSEPSVEDSEIDDTGDVPTDTSVAEGALQVPSPPVPKHRAEVGTAVVPSSSTAPLGDDLVSRIERLALLRAEGHLTAEEFSAAKARLIF